jgi:hypothetical protein
MKKIIFVLSFIFCVINLGAQTIDDVSLVVSGDGPTKESATHVALRSAIEQAYGVFVSANTEILNDELVKDEIATVTSGNVKSYEELSSVVLPNGNHLVSLKAVVSTKKLTAYAQSKGASCEFAGAIFGANLKLYELNKKNTEIAFENLIKQAKALAPYLYTPTLQMGTPQKSGDNTFEVPFTISLYSTPSTNEFINLIYSTLEALKINDEQLAMLDAMNLNYSTIDISSLYGRSFYCSFYVSFPLERFYDEVYNSLPKYYCIVDNFDNQYGEFYYHESLYNKLNNRIISLNGDYGGYSPFRIKTYIPNGIYFPPIKEIEKEEKKENDISLFSLFTNAKKKSKKNKKSNIDENIFTPKILNNYSSSIKVSEDILIYITNFKLLELTENQKNIHNLIVKYRKDHYLDSIPSIVNYIFDNDVDFYISFLNVQNFDDLYARDKNIIIYESKILSEINFKREDYNKALENFRLTAKILLDYNLYRYYGDNLIDKFFDNNIIDKYFECIKYGLNNNYIQNDIDLANLIGIWYKRKDNHTKEVIKHYFDYLNVIIVNNKNFRFEKINFVSENKFYITEVYNKIDKLIDKGVDINTIDAYNMYLMLWRSEERNNKWKTKFYFYKKII